MNKHTSPLAILIFTTSACLAQDRTITVLSATYGANCGAPNGNATGDFVYRCDGRTTCSYTPNLAHVNTAQTSCAMNLEADWQCTPQEMHTATISADASAGSTLLLTCAAQSGPGH